MVEMANGFQNNEDSVKKRMLNQMARELLIAQTSCWAFIMATGTTVDFAVREVKAHLSRFLDLYNMLKYNNINLSELENFEWRDSIFQEIDYMAFSDQHRIKEGFFFE
jgi:1,4-alpha-glucan branching enzyme